MAELQIESQTVRLRRMDGATRQLLKIIEERNLGTLFQPLVDPRERCVFGYEALTRGPSDSWLHSPQNLFETARRCKLREELEFLCLELAAGRFAHSRTPGRLFVNVSPDCIYAEARFTERLLTILAKAGLDADRCVIELTEDGLLDDYAMLRGPLQELREAGCEFAIDDLGVGSSGLRIWSELRPDYVKIDRYFISNIDSDPTKLRFVRSIVDLGRAIGCRIIAEGVESEGECRELIELGIDRLQGYMFGRPQPTPLADLAALSQLDVMTGSHQALCAEDLALRVPPVPAQMRVEELAELFRTSSARNTMVVVQDDRPVGVVRRHELFALLSKPFHLEVYNRKKVTAVMQAEYLTIDSRLRLEQVSRLVTQVNGARWVDEFLITADGKYLGIGLTLELLRRITEQQIQAAKHANPLTMLPGNGPIKDCIRRLLSDHRDFFVCYIDLDYFKPYNDVYGYVEGDRVIMHMAELLKDAIASHIDFLGHVGGDDFVLVMRSANWCERLNGVLTRFAASMSQFYTPEHVTDGYVLAADRDGEPHRFPLLSVSVAALQSGVEGCVSAEAAAHLLVEVKHQAKKRPGNSFLLRSVSGLHDALAIGGAEPFRSADGTYLAVTP